MEERKDIPGYEGKYMVSSQGNVKSVQRELTDSRGRKYLVKERILAMVDNSVGYKKVTLGQGNQCYIHRLVGFAFLGLINGDGMEINHKDGNPANNKLDNLEICTRSENGKHSYRVLKRASWWTGRTFGKCPNAIPITVICLKTGVSQGFSSINEAALKLGTKESTLYARVRVGKCKKFKYVKGKLL